jgi:hypothetical protein
MNRTTINHRLVNTLRHAGCPVQEDELATLYADPGLLHRDVGLLRRYALVQTTPAGVLWAGT